MAGPPKNQGRRRRGPPNHNVAGRQRDGLWHKLAQAYTGPAALEARARALTKMRILEPLLGEKDSVGRRAAWLLPMGLLVLAMTLVPLQMLDEQGLPRARSLQEEKRALKQRNLELRATTRRLHREVRELRSDPDAIERLARQELGLVRKGDLVIQFVP